MKIVFLNIEFTRRGMDAEIISLSMITEEKKGLYIEINDYNKENCNKWVGNEVVTRLKFVDVESDAVSEFNKGVKTEYYKCSKKEASEKVVDWIKGLDEEIEVWGSTMYYDWALFLDLLGNDLPLEIYSIPFDLSTALKLRGCDPSEVVWGFEKQNRGEDSVMDKVESFIEIYKKIKI